MRKLLFVGAFGLLYTIGTAAAMVLAMGTALSGFEPGEPRATSGMIQLFELLTHGLIFSFIPLFTPHEAWQYWGLVFGSGVLWGIALVTLWSALTRHRHRRRLPFLPAA